MARKKKVDNQENRGDRLISEWRYNLNVDQQKFIEENKDAKDILKLTQKLFDDDTINKHSKEFENVRSYYSKVNRNAYAFNFDSDQIDFIKNNGHLMRPIDIARHFFPDSKTNLTSEAKAAANIIKAFGIEYQGSDGYDESRNTSANYEPPMSEHKIIAIINRSDPNAGFAMQKLDSFKRECIYSLKKSLQSQRFIAVMNSIRRKDLRNMFELEFVNATYDKPDLNSEDRNIYITQCYDYVIATQIQEQIALLNDRIMEANGDSDDGRKMTMTLVEALTNARKEYNDCQSRITTNAKNLSGSRAKRNEQRIKESESLVQFIKMVKDEDGRKRMLLAAKAKEEELKQEIKRIADFDSIFVEVYGINHDEIIKI